MGIKEKKMEITIYILGYIFISILISIYIYILGEGVGSSGFRVIV